MKCPSLFLITFLVLKNLLCRKLAVTPAFFWLMLLAWCFFIHPFTFNLHVSLYLKWVSYGQYIVRCSFLIHSDSLFFQQVYFDHWCFKVFVNTVRLTSTIFVNVLSLLPFFFSLFLSSICDFKWLFYDLIFISFFYIIYISFLIFFEACNLHLQLIQVHFQITLYCFTSQTVWITFNNKIILIPLSRSL